MNRVLYQTVVITSLLLTRGHAAHGGLPNPTPSNAKLKTAIGNTTLQFVTVGDCDIAAGYGAQI